MTAVARNKFLTRTPEKENLNQYWYSKKTIEVIVDEVIEQTTEGRCAFLSTPSIYFSLPEPNRASCKVFDLDERFASDPNFVRYDFTQPLAIDEAHHHAYDMVVIDPPFITREVWEKYTATTKLLLKEGTGRILLTTTAENQPLIKELLGATPQIFQPSIPHLVYQYLLYTNYTSSRLAEKNPELIE